MQSNKPKHAEYVVPANAVVKALQTALGSLDNSPEGNGDINYCELALRRCGQDHMKLDVNLTLFDQFQALYCFNLTPVVTIDILKAKMLDLPNQFNPRNEFCAMSTTPTAGNDYVTWTFANYSTDEKWFAFGESMTAVTLLKRGKYQIRVTGHRDWSVGHCLCIVVDGKCVASRPTNEKLYWSVLSHHLVVSDDQPTLKIHCYGSGHPLEAGALLTVIYLGHFD
ncbi:hypothetical protein AC1031_007916 [Aphanomyces cochlioides]|nr:hypothetical protein AC1031_007909 [Aphanomyces cochlioides]KAG9414509.1 hypothetical protein AC1031_007916 [Aphanomyces cochlioides]